MTLYGILALYATCLRLLPDKHMVRMIMLTGLSAPVSMIILTMCLSGTVGQPLDKPKPEVLPLNAIGDRK